jgi:hypothetical protein
MPAASTRLFAILARKSRRAVVLRRGPSKRVALIAWDRATDEFEVGQWLKGRIYERRCDLSPAGFKFIYFAANWKEPYQSWTAISRPPWLTAVALWPKGDAWGGGGEFMSETSVQLNHPMYQMKLADGFTLPRHVRVAPLGPRSGGGEDFPLYARLLERGGWSVVDRGKAHEHDQDGEVRFRYDPPFVARRPNPRASRNAPELRMVLHGMGERAGRWYALDHALVDAKGAETTLARTDWADWDDTGDLLFAKGGELFRVPFRPARARPIDVADARSIADFSALHFTARESPLDARRW